MSLFEENGAGANGLSVEEAVATDTAIKVHYREIGEPGPKIRVMGRDVGIRSTSFHVFQWIKKIGFETQTEMAKTSKSEAEIAEVTKQLSAALVSEMKLEKGAKKTKSKPKKRPDMAGLAEKIRGIGVEMETAQHNGLSRMIQAIVFDSLNPEFKNDHDTPFSNDQIVEVDPELDIKRVQRMVTSEEKEQVIGIFFQMNDQDAALGNVERLTGLSFKTKAG